MKKIAHITDLHLDEQFTYDQGAKPESNLKRILDDVTQKGIDQVIFTGDIGSNKSNQWFFDEVSKYNFDLKITLGNHDVFSNTSQFFNPGLPEDRNELFYSAEDEHFKFIFLDSSVGEISSSQISWLGNELKSNKSIVIFIHHPVLETGATPQKEYPLKNGQEIEKALRQVDKEVSIFCGHLHMSIENRVGKVRQFVTPAACFQTKKESATTEVENINFGYRILNLDKHQLSSEVIMFEA